MAEQKTKAGVQSVATFLGTLDAARRADTEALITMMHRATGVEPKIWTGGMVGFGELHYRYASGHEGDTFEVGFAPRKGAITLYLPSLQGPERTKLLARLGPHRGGVGCVYLKRVADADPAVLEAMIVGAVKGMRGHAAKAKKAAPAAKRAKRSK